MIFSVMEVIEARLLINIEIDFWNMIWTFESDVTEMFASNFAKQFLTDDLSALSSQQVSFGRNYRPRLPFTNISSLLTTATAMWGPKLTKVNLPPSKYFYCDNLTLANSFDSKFSRQKYQFSRSLFILKCSNDQKCKVAAQNGCSSDLRRSLAETFIFQITWNKVHVQIKNSF